MSVKRKRIIIIATGILVLAVGVVIFINILRDSDSKDFDGTLIQQEVMIEIT